jgi:hypothetical protein
MSERRLWAFVMVAVASIALACSAPANGTSAPTTSSSPSSTPSTSPSSAASVSSAAPTPSYRPIDAPTESPFVTGQVTSAAQAAALVLASNALFAQIRPANPGVAGQSAWYTASAAGDGFSVSVTLGSGDCLAGCINSHTWNYSVSASGGVELVNESGDDVEVGLPTPGAGPAQVIISLVAGPVCPVQQSSPDPSCAPRPVVGAQVVVRDPSGTEVASATADQSGQAMFELPTGAYYAEASAADGFMRQPEPAAFSVVGGSAMSFSMEYDTGIR